MKRCVILPIVLILIVTLTGCGSPNDAAAPSPTNNDASTSVDINETYEWSVSCGLPVGSSWDLALNHLADLLDERTDGAIQLTIYSGGTLGSAREALEGVQMGSIDMIVESSANFSAFTDAMAVFDLPYLFENAHIARAVLSGETAAKQLEALEANGFKGISYWENGILATGAVSPIHNLDDIQGKRIRSIDSPVHADTYAALGAHGIVLTWGDIYTSLQQGVIDGVSSTTIQNMYTANFYEVAPYITTTNQGYSPATFVINLGLWNSLEPELQTIIMESVEDARQYQYQVTDELLAENIASMESQGVEFIELEDLEKWAEAVAPVYDAYVGPSGINPDIVEALKAEAEAVR